ncbi:hypothetical protein F7725_024482 [Dissostichus mawsoni]|uniref:LINE-1 type transposase domain-containing 1 n=1 Tax=Dissostichus mawsoni TaxID=36200 RepID=A0A7J5Y0B3_DISMA|nr:hypothetical protein F7725_024482 [Dissostichus mawsoni]
MPKQAKKTETAVSTASEVAGPDKASIISLLEEHRVSSELAQREHRASISADFKAAFAVLEAKLNQTQTTVAEHGEQIDSLETNANLQDQRLRILEEKCAVLADSNAKLAAKTADLEGRSRRNNIRIIGLPESIEGPRPTTFFSELLVELLGNETLQSPPELDCAHRAPAARPQPGTRPRPVIMRLYRYQVKDLIVREARKRRGDLRYRGTPVQIYEDFTQEVLEQRAKYRDIMSKLYNLGLRPALLFPARLQITLGSGAKKRPPDEINITNTQTNVIAFTSLIARRKILLLWKSPLPPSFKMWLSDTMSLLKLEKIKFTLRGSSDKFYAHWRPLISYVDRLPPDMVSL